MSEIVLSEEPFCAVVKFEYWHGKVCFNCFTCQAQASACGRCGQAWYCNKACQRADWVRGQHRHECGVFRQTASTPLHERLLRGHGKDVRLTARVIARLTPSGAISSYHPVNTRNFEDLLYRKEFGEEASEFGYVWNLFTNSYGKYSHFYSSVPESEFAGVYGRVCVNSHSIVRYNLRKSHSYGQAVYLQASALDHSCDADLDYYYDGSKIVLKSLKPLPPCYDLQKLTIPYCYLECQLRDRRKKVLMKNYHFECYCNQCSDDSVDLQQKFCINITCPQCENLMIVRHPIPSNKWQNKAECSCCNTLHAIPAEMFINASNFWTEFEACGSDPIAFDTNRNFINTQGSIVLHQVKNLTLFRIRQVLLDHYLEKCRRLEPGSSELLLQAVILPLWQQIIQTYETYGVVTPNHAAMQLSLGCFLAKNGDCTAATRHLQRAITFWEALSGKGCRNAERVGQLVKRIPASRDRQLPVSDTVV